MLSIRRALLALAAAALLPLAACKDSSGPDRRLVGEVSFTYQGDLSGRFEAEGRVTPANFASGTFALAQRGTDPDGSPFLLLYAQQGRENSDKYDALMMVIKDPAEGQVTCAPDDLDCPFFASFVLGQEDAFDVEGDAMFFGTSGRVSVTHLSDDRVRGTFQMPMMGFIGEAEGEVDVTSGSFDLPVLEENDAPFSRAEPSRGMR